MICYLDKCKIKKKFQELSLQNKLCNFCIASLNNFAISRNKGLGKFFLKSRFHPFTDKSDCDLFTVILSMDILSDINYYNYFLLKLSLCHNLYFSFYLFVTITIITYDFD